MADSLLKSNKPLSSQDLMSFSPADIILYMGGKPVRSVLSVTYSIQREVVALFGLGDANAQGFNRGKRGIAGSIVMNTFKDHPLLRSSWAENMGLFNRENGSGVTELGNFTGDKFKATVDDFAFNNGSFSLGTSPSFKGGTFSMIDQSLQDEISSSYEWVKHKKFNYVDQLPPFDIVLTFVNEMGAAAVMSINSVILANEGGGFSVDDITSETAFTYIARSITPMRTFLPSGIKNADNINYSNVTV